MFTSIKAEFKKITWPEKKEMVKMTTAVVVGVVVLGMIISGTDYIFQTGINFITGFFV